MQTAQGTVLQSLRAVQSFLNAHDDRLGDVNKTGARQRLDETVAQLSTHVAMQTGGVITAQGSTKKQYELRKTLLRDHMLAIVRVAKADPPPTPEIDAFKMPSGKPTVARLAAHAYGMAQAAAPFAAVFTSAGLPAGFITALTGAADAMVSSVNDRTQSKSLSGGATDALKARLTAGRKIVKVLDAFVQTALAGDPNLLGAWNQVKRVRKTASRPDTSAVATHPSTVPTGGTPVTPVIPTAHGSPATPVAPPVVPS